MLLSGAVYRTNPELRRGALVVPVPLLRFCFLGGQLMLRHRLYRRRLPAEEPLYAIASSRGDCHTSLQRISNSIFLAVTWSLLSLRKAGGCHPAMLRSIPAR